MLCSCSPGTSDINPLLAEREQQDVFHFYYEGAGLLSGFKERAQDKSSDIKTRFEEDYQRANEISKEVWKYIHSLERLKLNVADDLFNGSADRNVLNGEGGERALITEYNLSNCDPTVSTSDFAYNSKNGKELQHLMMDARKMLTEKLVLTSNRNGQKTYFFRDSGITDFTDLLQLGKQVEQLVKASNVAPDDRDAVISIYCKLSINKKDWKELLPEENNCLEVFRLIHHLEKELLKAQNDVFRVMESRFCIADYGFDKILSVANGDNVVSAGDTLEIAVAVAAFNSMRNPAVTCETGKVIESSVEDGIGRIKVIVPKNTNHKTLNYKGTISIITKSGVAKTVPWTKEVYVQ